LDYALHTFENCVRLAVAPSSKEGWISLVKEWGVMKTKVKVGQEIIFLYYDEKVASECQTAPWERRSPTRSTFIPLIVKNFVDEFGLPPGFAVVYADGGKKNIVSANMGPCFNDLKDKGTIHTIVYDVLYDEDAWRERGRHNKKTFVDAREGVYMWMTDPRTLPVRKRQQYAGSTTGRSWGWLVMDPVEQTLLVEHGKKKELYGPIALRPSGGPPDGECMLAPGNLEGSEIKGDTQVPLCWRTFPRKFGKCLLGSNNCTQIMDATLGDGTMCYCAAANNTKYFGLGHTEGHIDLVKQWVITLLLKDMADQQSPLYVPTYAVFLAKKTNLAANQAASKTHVLSSSGQPSATRLSMKKRTKPRPRSNKKAAEQNKDSSDAPESATEEEESDDDPGDDDAEGEP
jgi:hypothetical protein